MALATYSDLKASLASWLHRTDLTSQIPDFITMAESRLNRLLTLRQMEMETTLTMTPGSRYVTLPTDFNGPVALWLETYPPRQKLTLCTAAELPVTSNVNGSPNYWAIDGLNVAFDRPADQAHTLTFRYIKTFTLTDAAPTNALLSSYPDAYLFGALLEAVPYLNNDARLPMWQERFDRAVKEISNNENESKSRAPLTTEVSALRGRRFNIFRGW